MRGQGISDPVDLGEQLAPLVLSTSLLTQVSFIPPSVKLKGGGEWIGLDRGFPKCVLCKK